MSTQFQLNTIARNENGLRFGLMLEDYPLSYGQVIDYWRQSPEFVRFYIEQINQLAFEGLFWEHPPLTQSDLSQPYEAMVMRTGDFSKRPVDPTAFQAYFKTDKDILAFDNLSKDARLVAPNNSVDHKTCKHLGSFLTKSSNDQLIQLFQIIAIELTNKLLKGKRVWLNTSGMGVMWLHVRLDKRPKYYKIKAYKNPDFWSKKRT